MNHGKWLEILEVSHMSTFQDRRTVGSHKVQEDLTDLTISEKGFSGFEDTVTPWINQSS